jgi:hypothetical protein
MKILITHCKVASALVAALVTFSTPGIAAATDGGSPGIVLFPFDDHSLPFNRGLNLSLIAGSKHKRQDPILPDRPVLAIGQPGDPDHPRAYFLGTVLEVEGEYRMWYTGYDKDRNRQVCYAVSKDGLTWTKPKLGLVTYNGNRDNNLVALDGDHTMHAAVALVLHDPDDPDPKRRYKMLREHAVPGVSWQIFAAVSPDGVNWTSAAGGRPINPNHQIEPSGFIRHKGVYYLNGHSNVIRHPLPGAHKRTMQTFASYDFETWTGSSHMSFRRDNIPPRPPTDFEGHRGPQVHLGAALWDRGNVVLGFYGMYDNPTNDRRTVVCDIGLIVSHNAVNFHEPVPDFKIVPSLEEADRAEPRLTQGQAFLNIGDRTFHYYGIWTEVNRDGPTGVRVASWARDRLGYYATNGAVSEPHCISAPLKLPRADARVYLNATGLSADTRLEVEILDEQFRPLPGFAATDCVPFESEAGLRLPVTWRGKTNLSGLQGPVRVRVNFSGRDAGKARLYAIYIE